MACSLWAQAQSIDRTQVLYSATAPSGACGYGYIVVVKSTGDAYSCDNGTWGLIGGAGTVTSVSGTPNQIVCNGTVSITCGLANPLTAPGVANFPSGIITGTPGDASSIGVYSADGTEVVWLGATTGYNGTNTWDGNPPTSGYFWGAYGVSGDNATVGWQAPGTGCVVTVAQLLAIDSPPDGMTCELTDAASGSDTSVGGNPGNLGFVTSLGGEWMNILQNVTGFPIALDHFLGVDSSNQLTLGAAYTLVQNNGTSLSGPGKGILNFTNGGCSLSGPGVTNCTFATPTGSLTSGHIAAWDGTSGLLQDGGAVPTGANYNGFGMWQIAVPVSSNFTAFNTSSQTITSGTHFLSINSEHSTGGGSHYISGLHTACPAAPWTIWALISIVAPNSGGATNTNVGIEVDDGTKYVTVGPEYPFGSSQILAAFSFSNSSTYNATIGDNAYQMSNTPIWYYASNSGGTLTLGYSIDGTSLTTLGTSTYLSANTNCGMFADNSNANNGVIADVFAWNVFNTASASLVAQ
jgi:hypothetical protein